MSRVFLSGVPLCALAVLALSCDPSRDHSQPSGLLDPDTQALVGGLGHWSSWYSVSLERAANPEGGHSLSIQVTAPYSWGVGQDNYPGFTATPGPYHAEYWARLAAGSPQPVSLTVHWRDESGNDLESHPIGIAFLGSTWQRASTELVAPAGTTRIALDILGDQQSAPGDVIQVTDVLVEATSP